MNPHGQTALLYVKFRALAPKLKYLIAEIENRAIGHKEYVQYITFFTYPISMS